VQPETPKVEGKKAKAKKAAKPVEQTDAEKQAAKEAKAKEQADKKAQREKDRAEKKAKREAEAAAKPAVKRWGSNKVGRIKDALGEQPLVLEVTDAALSPEDLKSKSDATIEAIGKQSIKVKNRVALIVDYVLGKSAEQTFVHGKAFEVLNRDGKLETGDKGNFHAALLSKPYSVGAARAMGRNTINTLAVLKVIVAGEKGVFLPNPQSMVLAQVKELMKLS
jgi:hypothetical protein